MRQAAKQETLHERDYSLWLEDVLTKLKARDIDNLDWENLIEEIEALGKSQKREVKSRLDVLLAHLLKRIYVNSAYDNHGWENTIEEQRRQLQLLFEDSPSLMQYCADVFDDCCQYALRQVRKDYPSNEFPEQWQFSRDVDGLLSEQFWQ